MKPTIEVVIMVGSHGIGKTVHAAISQTCLGAVTVVEHKEPLREPMEFTIHNIPVLTTDFVLPENERKAKRPNANPSDRNKRRW